MAIAGFDRVHAELQPMEVGGESRHFRAGKLHDYRNFNKVHLHASKVTGFTIKWLEIMDSYKATVAMANGEVELVIANAGTYCGVHPFFDFL